MSYSRCWKLARQIQEGQGSGQGGGGREEQPKLQQGKKVPLPTTLNVRLARSSRGQRVYGVCLGNEFGDKMGTNFLVSGSRVRTRRWSRDGRSAEAGETVDTCEGERDDDIGDAKCE